VAALRRLGVRVQTGILEAECRALNEVFEVLIRKMRPWVLAKAAVSLDGRLAPPGGRAQRLTGDACQRRVHRLRAMVDAVLVGAGTIRCDDPRLDVRHARGRNPAVAILDGRLSCSPRARVFGLSRGAPVFLYTSRNASGARVRALERQGVVVVRMPARAGRLPLRAVLADLLSRGIHRLLVEGGADVLGQFLSAGAVDRLEVHLAPLLLGDTAVPLARFAGAAKVRRALHLEDVRWHRLGADGICSGRLLERESACSLASSKTSAPSVESAVPRPD
jgi:diaminohydroxyphosphoribosylaminopyrimidine deaminase/5-amino-6-(5-phosphoribosylamino)uracil reductase